MYLLHLLPRHLLLLYLIFPLALLTLPPTPTCPPAPTLRKQSAWFLLVSCELNAAFPESSRITEWTKATKEI